MGTHDELYSGRKLSNSPNLPGIGLGARETTVNKTTLPALMAPVGHYGLQRIHVDTQAPYDDYMVMTYRMVWGHL